MAGTSTNTIAGVIKITVQRNKHSPTTAPNMRNMHIPIGSSVFTILNQASKSPVLMRSLCIWMMICMKITTTVAGTPTFTLVWDGVAVTTPGMIHGTTAAGVAPGTTVDGTIHGIMVGMVVMEAITDGTIHGITVVGTLPGIAPGILDLAVTMAATMGVTMGVVTLTGSMTVITAV